jgi:hypothetical protein
MRMETDPGFEKIKQHRKNSSSQGTEPTMPSSGMLRCVDLVRKDDSEERKASIIRVTRIGEQKHSMSSQCASVAS